MTNALDDETKALIQASDSHFLSKPIFAITISVVTVVVLLMAITAWIAILLNSRVEQVMEVTACIPGSDPCEEWFSGPGDRLMLGESVRVVGEVCNATNKALSYDVVVAWESTLSSARLTVVEAPITFQPGCDDYDYTFSVPETIFSVDDGSGSFGVWKLVGFGRPVNESLALPFRWEATGSVEIVAAP